MSSYTSIPFRFQKVSNISSVLATGRLENAIGWYHSHPGYGCWLSGIDVSTQMLNQNFQEPFVAIVVDPVRTVSAGKVCLGAFRTYPKGYKPPNEEPSEYQTIPLNKIEDFGVQAILFDGSELFQVGFGSQTARFAVEQILGQHAR